MSKKQAPVVLKVDSTIQLLNNCGKQGFTGSTVNSVSKDDFSVRRVLRRFVSIWTWRDAGEQSIKRNKIDLFLFSISSWFSFLLISLVLSNHSLDNRLARAHKPGTSKFGFDDQIWRSLFCRLSRMFLLVLLFCFDPFSSATQGNLESWLSFDDVFAKSRSGERCLCTTGPKIRRC